MRLTTSQAHESTVQDELLSLANHHLSAVTKNIKLLQDVATATSNRLCTVIIMLNVEVQSLKALAEKNSTDSLFWLVNIQTLTETGMDTASPINIEIHNWIINCLENVAMVDGLCTNTMTIYSHTQYHPHFNFFLLLRWWNTVDNLKVDPQQKKNRSSSRYSE